MNDEETKKERENLILCNKDMSEKTEKREKRIINNN